MESVGHCLAPCNRQGKPVQPGPGVGEFSTPVDDGQVVASKFSRLETSRELQIKSNLGTTSINRCEVHLSFHLARGPLSV